MSQLEIFISSRERELEPEREIAATLIESLGMKPVRFELDRVPQPLPPRDAYLKSVESSDLFVLLLWKEHSQAVIEEYECARRRGKPILCLFKTPKAEHREARTKQLWQFIQRIKSDGYSTSDFRTLRQLQDQLRQGIALTLVREKSSQFHASSKEELFLAGTELIEQAQQRVILLAKTPLPLVGTRPYDEAHAPASYEEEQQQAVNRLIEEATRKGSKKFRCVAVVPSMKEDIDDNEQPFRERVRQRIRSFHAKTRKPDSRCELRWISGNLASGMSFLVADNNFLIWLSDGSRESVWMQARNERMATALDRISMRTSIQIISLKAIYQTLGL